MSIGDVALGYDFLTPSCVTVTSPIPYKIQDWNEIQLRIIYLLLGLVFVVAHKSLQSVGYGKLKKMEIFT